MFSQPAGVPSPTIFEPLVAPSTASIPTSPTSSARRRLSGLFNLRSYAANSLLSNREASSSRNLNRHSIHGAIFRSSPSRSPNTNPNTNPDTNPNTNPNISPNTSPSTSPSTHHGIGHHRRRSISPNITPNNPPGAPSPSRDESISVPESGSGSGSGSAFAATIADALRLNGSDYLAGPLSITLDTAIASPISAALPTSANRRGFEPDSRRFSTRFCETAAAALLQERAASSPGPEPELPSDDADMTRSRSATLGTVNVNDMSPAESLPSIRLSAFYDPRSSRPSLSFSPVARTLPTGKETIKVGRYSERENHAPIPMNAPSAAPVGFKSKVVSRRHCEFWFEKGKWYIRDVKSSSGTFLNHIRLAAPGTESKPYPINDGDIVQLGIDFKGGEEMIYRCVKMRIELNRGWQAKPNTFNVTTHQRLRDLTSTAGSGPSHAQDCSICLNAIAPCQSLFVAPCSHTWHYKCIREMLQGPSAPIFICPNCRATADLDAEVEEPADDWQQLPGDFQQGNTHGDAAQESNSAIPSEPQLKKDSHTRHSEKEDSADVTMDTDDATPASATGPSRHAVSHPVPIPNGLHRRTPSPTRHGVLHGHEGLITPRNDAGPWVFDGNPARVSQENTRRNAMGSLDAAAQIGPNQI